jgi:hypothetical protein
MISADFARAACASGEVMVCALVTLALAGWVHGVVSLLSMLFPFEAMANYRY